MTRQNVTDGPRESLTTKCSVCAGDGFVVSDATHALDVERKLRDLARGSRVQGFRVAVHPRVLWLLAGAGGSRLEAIEAAARRRFFLVPAQGENGHVHLDHFEVLAQGKLETLAPDAPVKEGAKLELKLVEVGLYDPAAGVGKVDGWDVVVAGAGKLVGKKVKVTVGRVLDGVAYATPVDGALPPAPITFEAEAEKPTRAPSRKAKPTPEPAEEPEAAEPGAAPEPEAEAELSPEALETEEEGAEPEEGAKKKRTRRGTRGGRGRKKTTAADAPATEEPPAEAEAEVKVAKAPPKKDARKRAPRNH
jgi:predicted RNA-binding protein with TRAM domain